MKLRYAIDKETGKLIDVEKAVSMYGETLVSSKPYYCPHCNKRVIPVRPEWKVYHWRHTDNSPGCPEYFPGNETYPFPQDGFDVRQFLSKYGYHIRDSPDPFEPDLIMGSSQVWIKSKEILGTWSEEDLSELGKVMLSSPSEQAILIVTNWNLVEIREYGKEMTEQSRSNFCKMCGAVLIFHEFGKLRCPKCAGKEEIIPPERYGYFVDQPMKAESFLAQSMKQNLVTVHVGFRRGFAGPVSLKWIIPFNGSQLKFHLPVGLRHFGYNKFRNWFDLMKYDEIQTDAHKFQVGQWIMALTSTQVYSGGSLYEDLSEKWCELLDSKYLNFSELPFKLKGITNKSEQN